MPMSTFPRPQSRLASLDHLAPLPPNPLLAPEPIGNPVLADPAPQGATGLGPVMSRLARIDLSPPRCEWIGANGGRYIASVSPLETLPFDLAAVYLVVRRDPFGVPWSLYVGQTQNVNRRLSEHEAGELFALARWLGATELHLHVVPRDGRHPDHLEAILREIEGDLIAGLAPPLNGLGLA